MKLHEKIAYLRRRNRWSQEDLAEWTGVSRQSVSKWESGQATPDTRYIVRLSRLFSVTTDQLLLDDLLLPGEEAVSELPDAPEGIRRITAEDTYAFTVFCQREARSFALACASLPMAPALMFLCFGLSELLPGDSGDSLLFSGFMLGIIVLLVGLCELVCAWLSGCDRKLNGGKPYILDARALEWASDASIRYQQISTRWNRLSLTLALLIIPVFFGCVGASIVGGSDFWIGAALSAPLALISAITYLCARTARTSRCYRRLIERARQQEADGATDG